MSEQSRKAHRFGLGFYCVHCGVDAYEYDEESRVRVERLGQPCPALASPAAPDGAAPVLTDFGSPDTPTTSNDVPASLSGLTSVETLNEAENRCHQAVSHVAFANYDERIKAAHNEVTLAFAALRSRK